MVMLDLFIITFLILASVVGVYFLLKPQHDQAVARKAEQRAREEERRDRSKARWYPENRLSANRQYTSVYVVLRTPKGNVLEERQVGIPIANADDAYDFELSDCMNRARMRALTLNVELEPAE